MVVRALSEEPIETSKPVAAAERRRMVAPVPVTPLAPPRRTVTRAARVEVRLLAPLDVVTRGPHREVDVAVPVEVTARHGGTELRENPCASRSDGG